MGADFFSELKPAAIRGSGETLIRSHRPRQTAADLHQGPRPESPDIIKAC